MQERGTGQAKAHAIGLEAHRIAGLKQRCECSRCESIMMRAEDESNARLRAV